MLNTFTIYTLVIVHCNCQRPFFLNENCFYVAAAELTSDLALSTEFRVDFVFVLIFECATFGLFPLRSDVIVSRKQSMTA